MTTHSATSVSKYRPAPGDFRARRILLNAALPHELNEDLGDFIELVETLGPEPLSDYLKQQGLRSFWHERIVSSGNVVDVPERLVEALKSGRREDAFLYMAQTAALHELDEVLTRQGIEYAVIKGAHVRERVYANPAFRTANDIDLLIAHCQRSAAVEALRRSGYSLEVDIANLSRQVTLRRGLIAIDLHWDILSPGRMRTPVSPQIISRRRRFNGFWGVSDEDAAFLMLVHPVFAKYCCNLALCNVADFANWLHACSINWDDVIEMLERTGLKAAAWAALDWYSRLLPPSALVIPERSQRAIWPGPARRAYVGRWIKSELPIPLRDFPLVIQIAFTLPMHDHLADVFRAVRFRLRERHMNRKDPFVAMSCLSNPGCGANGTAQGQGSNGPRLG